MSKDLFDDIHHIAGRVKAVDLGLLAQRHIEVAVGVEHHAVGAFVYIGEWVACGIFAVEVKFPDSAAIDTAVVHRIDGIFIVCQGHCAV